MAPVRGGHPGQQAHPPHPASRQASSLEGLVAQTEDGIRTTGSTSFLHYSTAPGPALGMELTLISLK